MTGALLLFFGAVYTAFGLELGWLGAPLVWLGASCALAGIAFVLGKPHLMGKRADGTFAPGFLLVLAPFLALSWLGWQLRRRRREPCWHEVAPGLFLGRLAALSELPPGTEMVVDLTCELAEPAPIRRMNYRCLPTLDGCAPDPQRFLALARDVAAFPKAVFIHCAAGHGRSATLAAAVLLARGAVPDLAAAEALLKSRRPGVDFSPAQRRLLAEFARHAG